MNVWEENTEEPILIYKIVFLSYVTESNREAEPAGWHKPVVLTAWEAEAGGLSVQGLPRQFKTWLKVKIYKVLN